MICTVRSWPRGVEHARPSSSRRHHGSGVASEREEMNGEVNGIKILSCLELQAILGQTTGPKREGPLIGHRESRYIIDIHGRSILSCIPSDFR